MAHQGPVSFCPEDLKCQKETNPASRTHNVLKCPSAKPQFNFTLSLKTPFIAGLHTELFGEASGALFGIISIQEADKLWQFGILTLCSYSKSKLCRMSPWAKKKKKN